MADRLDYYFRQKVTEAELDLTFELLEKADRNLAAGAAVIAIDRTRSSSCWFAGLDQRAHPV